MTKTDFFIILVFVPSFLFGQDQPRFMDIGFGPHKIVGSAAGVIELLEKNEPYQVLSFLSIDANVEIDSIVAYADYLQPIKKDEKFLPPTLPRWDYSGDTLYYERHYFHVADNGYIEFLAQIIVILENKKGTSNILDILFKKSEFVDRRVEIRLVDDGTWYEHLSTVKPKVEEY